MGTSVMPPDVRKACLILGLRPEQLTVQAVKEAWKQQVASPHVHPDLGGDPESAIYLNMAKETLLEWLGKDPGGPTEPSLVPRRPHPEDGSTGTVVQFPKPEDEE